MATVLQGLNLDELADFRSEVTDFEARDGDEPYHQTLGKVAAWIEKLKQIQASALWWGWFKTSELDVISEMLFRDPADRPVASAVLEKMGGARLCCEEEREAYEAEDWRIIGSAQT
jgi:hypothetical protein